MEDTPPPTATPPAAKPLPDAGSEPRSEPLMAPVPAGEWIISEAASWLCLSAGLLVLSLTLLIPEMIRNQQIAHQLRVLELQETRATETLERHKNVLEALEYDDPVLLEHLALTQLRLKPVGTHPLTAPRVDPAANATSVYDLQNYVAGSTAVDAVENWLNPIPRPAGEVIPKYRPPPTLLVHWTSERPARGISLFLGIVLAVVGLWPKVRAGRLQPT